MRVRDKVFIPLIDGDRESTPPSEGVEYFDTEAEDVKLDEKVGTVVKLGSTL